MRFSSPLLLLILVACEGEQPVVKDISDKPDDVEVVAVWSIDLTLDARSVVAGESVGYSVVLTDQDGVEGTLSSWTLSSDTEDVFFDRTSLAPTLAGEHQIVVDAVVDGQALSAKAKLTVDAGAVFGIDLAVTDMSAAAGEELTWTVAGWDAYGNDADVSGAVVEGDPELTVGPGTVSATLPGSYSLSATLDDVDDVEAIVVVPGAPDAVTLGLDTDVELYETASASVEVVDAFGNLTGDPWTLTVDGGSTTVSHRNITFWEEGWYTVTATVDGTTLSDEVGPFLIDSTAPSIVVDSPARGTWIEDTSVVVSGTVVDAWAGGATLQLDGVDVVLDGSGAFSETVALLPGTTTFELVATDADGNTTSTTRSVLAGDFLADEGEVDDGVIVRLEEGPGGLGALEEMGEGLIGANDLDDLLPPPNTPVFSDSEEDCFDPCGGVLGGCEICQTWYEVDLYVSNPDMGTTDLTLDAKPRGEVVTTMVANDVSLDWNASGVVLFVPASGQGTITADSITVQLDLDPKVTPIQRNVKIDFNDVSASAQNFDFDMDGWLFDVITFFGVDVDGMVEDAMTDAIEDAVTDEVPPLVDDALTDLELAFGIDLGGVTQNIVAEPSDIVVDANGLHLVLGTTVVPDTWVRTGLGSLYVDYGQPTWTGASGTVVGMSSDTLNQLLYGVWGAGVMDLQADTGDLGLDVSELSALLPGVDALTVVVDPLLPPVVVPTSSGNELQLGDLEVTLYEGDPVDDVVFLKVYVSGTGDLLLDADADGTLSADLADLDLLFDVVEPEGNTSGAADTEALLEFLVPSLLPSLTDAIGGMQIPSIEGLTLTSVSVDQDGPESGYLTLSGDLE